MAKLFNVTLAWGQDDEGNFSSSAWADNEAGAALQVAEEMADSSDAPDFESDAERTSWIKGRADDLVDIYPADQQLRQDLGALFSNELFPDGVSRDINLEQLGKVLAENRERLIVRS